jgi:prepilin-type N-terminal cleavage/methylation domain-containing protein
MILKFNNKKKYSRKTQNLQNGFSIIEVMAAISIISVGMIGVLSLVTQNIQVASANQKELLSAQLAREGLELVRNRRDQNWITVGNNWKTGASSMPPSDIVQDLVYTIDYINGITNISDINDVNAVLKINSNGFYEHGAGTVTPFSRIITITQNENDFIEVECTVQWQERGGVKSYVASTILYNWR